MAKIWLFVCLLLVAKLSKSAPIWDEEVEDDEDIDNLQPLNNDNDANDRSIDKDDDSYGDDGQDNDEDSDYKVNDIADGWGNAGENKYDEGDEVEDEVNERGEDDGMDEDQQTDAIDIHPANDVTERVVEDFEGDMALDKKTELDEYEIETEEKKDEDDLTDMGHQISKLKTIFNEDMPQEIAALQSHSESLSKDLDSLNAKLENFLKDNGIKQDPAVPKPSDKFDYTYE